MNVDDIFGGFEDLSGTFSVLDVTLAMLIAFVGCAVIGLTYRTTHRGVSYSQSYVQTLVLMGMVIALIMLVVGSNIARAFSLVGALSIIRFRNAVKETRDVGFIFFAMAIGMAAGTRFFLLAVIATVVICLAIVVMDRFNWFNLDIRGQVVKVEVPPDRDYTSDIDDVLGPLTREVELLSAETIRGGALVELVYSVRLKPDVNPGEVTRVLAPLASGQRVTVLTGYDRTDL
ncbi:MAG TPA: DUF4956 domain-containing protein [Nocardioidaceae bacterium]|nr:DUF4956 domain-containing protein [Nocardioidaceae bacterium]